MEVKTKVCAACSIEKNITQFTVSGRKGYRNKRCKLCISNKISSKPSTETRICVCCGEKKTLNDFYKNATYSSGYENKCKVCKNNKVLIPKEKRQENGTGYDGYSFKISQPSIEDFIEAYTALKKLGYDLTSNKTIHEQFCERYNLRPKKRQSILNTKYDMNKILEKVI